MTFTPGMRSRTSATHSGENRPCTEQCPRHKIIVASRSCVGSQAAGLARRVRVPHDAVVQAHPHLQHRRVAAQVLIRQEQDLAALAKRPLEGAAGIGRRAHGAAVAPGERLDVRRGVHVRDWDHLVGDAEVLERIPALLDLVIGRHVRHRAASREVGQDDLLLRRREDVGRLGHEMNAAEHHELSARPRRRLARELEGISSHVRKLDDFVTLVVVAEDEGAVTERFASRSCPRDQGRVAGWGQLAGAAHAPLSRRIRARAEH